MISSKSQVLWVPGTDGSAGVWAAVSDACFLEEDHDVPECVLRVGRQAGRLIPDEDQAAVKVSGFLMRMMEHFIGRGLHAKLQHNCTENGVFTSFCCSTSVLQRGKAMSWRSCMSW